MSEHDDKNPGSDQFREMTQNIFDSLRDLVRKSADEVVAGAKVTRSRLDIFQLRRDRDHFLMRLGQSAYTLLAEGGVSHPDLEQAYQRVRTIEEKIVEYERDITDTGMEAEAEPVEPAPAPEEAPVEKAEKKAAPKARKQAKKPAAKKTAKKTDKKADKKPAKKVKKASLKAGKKTSDKKPAKKKTDKKTGGKSTKTL